MHKYQTVTILLKSLLTVFRSVKNEIYKKSSYALEHKIFIPFFP